MTMVNFEKIVGEGFYSEAEKDLIAYSYDSSQLEERAIGVVWPKDAEEVRRIVFACNQNNISVVCRGNGTTNQGASISRNAALIVDFSARMNQVLRFNTGYKYVDVQPGITIDDLNAILKHEGFVFPLIPPKSAVTTIGGMVASNIITKQSFRYGSLAVWISEIDFVDGTGKTFTSTDVARFIGSEGCVGVFTRMRLRIKRIEEEYSYTIRQFDNFIHMLQSLDAYLHDTSIESITFYDALLASEFNISKPCFFIKYLSMKGEKKNYDELVLIEEYERKINKVIAQDGFLIQEDLKIPVPKLFDVLQYAEKNKFPCKGNIALQHLELYFSNEEQRNAFLVFAKHLNLDFCNGYGLAKKPYVPQEVKAKIFKLKDEYDYNNILNRSKVVDYQ
jgi:FAD/FMN-containing dehydrogenase